MFEVGTVIYLSSNSILCRCWQSHSSLAEQSLLLPLQVQGAKDEVARGKDMIDNITGWDLIFF